VTRESERERVIYHRILPTYTKRILFSHEFDEWNVSEPNYAAYADFDSNVPKRLEYEIHLVHIL